MNRSLLAIATCGIALLAQAPVHAARAPHAHYIDITSTLQTDADFNAWYDGGNRLTKDFDDICGDTYCEGDYSNIQALRLVCSVEQTSGEVGQCEWSFAASDEAIDQASGQVQVTVPSWRCVAPVAPHTTRQELLDFFANSAHPLYAALPHTSATMSDALADCL